MNHDALFKSLLRTGRILRDFFEAFLPRVAAFVDFDHVEFLDKERFTVEGRRRTGDLLVKTRFRGEESAFLIHLEHEAQPRPDLARRLLEYFLLDWRDFDLPVYPIAVLSHPEPNPELASPLRLQIREEDILCFKFTVVDLARLQASDYVKQLNAAAMALSSRMRNDPAERLSLAVDFIRGAGTGAIGESELDAAAQFFFAYQQFDKEEALKLKQELDSMEDVDIPKSILLKNPLVQFGIEKGVRRGLQRGTREGRHRETALVVRLLSRKLGPLSSNQAEIIRKLPLKDVEALGEALLDFRSKADLTRWLNSRAKRAK